MLDVTQIEIINEPVVPWYMILMMFDVWFVARGTQNARNQHSPKRKLFATHIHPKHLKLLPARNNNFVFLLFLFFHSCRWAQTNVARYLKHHGQNVKFTFDTHRRMVASVRSTSNVRFNFHQVLEYTVCVCLWIDADVSVNLCLKWKQMGEWMDAWSTMMTASPAKYNIPLLHSITTCTRVWHGRRQAPLSMTSRFDLYVRRKYIFAAFIFAPLIDKRT